MRINTPRVAAGLIALALLFVVAASVSVPAQSASSARPVLVPQGQKQKVQGVVSIRSRDSFKVREPGGNETTVLLTGETDVTSHRRGLRRKKDYPVTYIMRGLRLQAQGTGDADGNLVAEWVRFDEQDLRAAQALEQTAELAEENLARLKAAEENARVMADQLRKIRRSPMMPGPGPMRHKPRLMQLIRLPRWLTTASTDLMITSRFAPSRSSSK